MAYIDKTYITTIEEATEFFNWYNKSSTRVEMSNTLGHIIGLYRKYIDYFKGEEEPLWNTSTKEDTYLIRSCPVSFVQTRLIEQYGKEFVDFIKAIHKDDYLPFHSIMRIERNSNTAYFFSQMDKNQSYSVTLNRILVYGTTFFHDFLKDAIYSLSHNNKDGFKILFLYFGKACEYDNGTIRAYNEKTEEYDIPITFGVYDNDIDLPRITHSFKMSDSKGYNTDGIILSGEHEFHAASDYKGHNMSDLWRYVISSIPRHIYKLIKKNETNPTV